MLLCVIFVCIALLLPFVLGFCLSFFFFSIVISASFHWWICFLVWLLSSFFLSFFMSMYVTLCDFVCLGLLLPFVLPSCLFVFLFVCLFVLGHGFNAQVDSLHLC